MKYEDRERIYKDAVLGNDPFPDDTEEMLEYRKSIDDDIEKYQDFTYGIPDE